MANLPVPEQQAPTPWTQEQKEVIRRTLARGATDDELYMYLRLATVYGLDPFRRELVMQIRNGQDDRHVTFITSRDGYLKAAMRDPGYAGLQSMVVREGDHFEIDPTAGKVVHRFGAKRGPIIGAWAIAYHKERPPVIFFADFQEYFEANRNSPTWQKYPSAMIQKVAEVGALRRQFSLSGIVAREEIEGDLPSAPAAPATQPAEPLQPEVLPPEGEASQAPAHTPPPATNGATRPMTDAQRRAIFAISRRLAVDANDLARAIAGVPVSDLTTSQASQVITRAQQLTPEQAAELVAALIHQPEEHEAGGAENDDVPF